jgi:hypothetical protein
MGRVYLSIVCTFTGYLCHNIHEMRVIKSTKFAKDD